MKSGALLAKTVVFLAYFAACLALRRLSLEPDGLAYLHFLDVPRHVDLVHALYVPTLGALRGLLDGDGQLAGQLFSAFCGAVYVVALWRLLERLGLRALPAATAALLVGLSSPFLTSAVTVEVYTPAHAAMVVTLLLAEGYGRTGRWTWLPGIAVTATLAVGFHAFTVFAAPAALWLMGLPKGVKLRHLWIVPLAVAVPAGAFFLLDAEWINIQTYLDFAKGFLPDPEQFEDPWAMLQVNANSTLQFLLTAPPVLLLTVPGLVCAWGTLRRACVLSLVWGLPFLIAFLAVRVSFWGLLLPLLGALTVPVAAGAQSVLDQGGRVARAWCLAILAGSLVWVGAKSLPTVDEASRTLDPYAESALRIADRVGDDVCVFAGGHVAIRLELGTDVRFVSLEVVNRTLSAEEKPRIMQKVRELAAAEAEEGFKPYLTTDGVLFLQRLGIDTVGTLLSAADEAIDLSSEELELVLHPLDTSGEAPDGE